MSIALNVDINARDIEAQVVTAIAQTAFGDQLKKAVEEALKTLGNRYSYDNELKKWVESKMRAIVFDYIEKNCTEQIETAIKEWLTSDKIKEVTGKVIGEVVSNLTTKDRY